MGSLVGIPSVASGNGVLEVPLTGVSTSGGPHRRMRYDKRLYLQRVTSRGFYSPIVFKPVWVKVQLGIQQGQNEASVQSFCSMVELSPV